MRTRILSALTWPGRKLIGLERSGRAVMSLAVVDAGGLALWLFTLNGYVFHRALDLNDWLAAIGVPVLCYAACLLYGLEPGRPWWRWVAKALLAQGLATALLHGLHKPLGMTLNGQQALKLAGSYVPWLILTRMIFLACRRLLPRAPLECLRLVLVAGAGFFFFGGRFVTSGAVGAGDSYWYCIMLADFVKQWRAGVFPVFVGQSEYAFNGAVSPLRYAPGLQHAAGLVDLLTGRALPFYTLQNLTLFLAALGGIYSAYFCAAAILPGRRWTAAVLAALYLACPGILALGYQGDLYMSMTTLPFVPLACYGIWRTLQYDGHTSIAWTVLPLAAAWYCHPPIAFWLTFVAALGHLSIGVRRWRDPKLYVWWGQGLVLFLLAAGFLFVSVATLHLPQLDSNIYLLLESVRSAFPGMLLPITNDPSSLGNYQLGWTLGALLIFALIGCLFRPRRAEGVVLVGAGAMILLLLPIPRLNAAIWTALPKTVRDITFLWPMQRFYVVLAGLTVMAAAGTWSKLNPKRVSVQAIAFVLLGGGLAWSCQEAATFVLHDYFTRGPAPAPVPEPMLERNNIILTRYAFTSFGFAPPYYTHGYTDPYLENRVLAGDLHAVLASNLAAAEPSEAASPISLLSTYDGVQVDVLAPTIMLEPGLRYTAKFVPSGPLGPGTFFVAGKAVQRTYYMPDSGMGMIHHGPGNAFGFLPTSRDFFPIWTAQAQPEAIQFRYIFNQVPTVPVPRAFARLYLRTYTPGSLPVAVSSWMPYRATTNVATAGAWLETPRMYLPGYAARVNGRPAEVAPTPGGLVAVRLQTGRNEVTLSYPGPWRLQASYWISLLTWLGVGAILIGRVARAWRRAIPL